jgi:type I restriction enzyme R subunit
MYSEFRDFHFVHFVAAIPSAWAHHCATLRHGRHNCTVTDRLPGVPLGPPSNRQYAPNYPHQMKEAAARIKINKLLETRGWRFFADAKGPANIQLEPSVALTTQVLDALGENFEKVTKGLIDFLLLNEKGFPFIVLEAKAENKNPLVGKEQARRYAKSQNCRFVILSNGNLHYFWDLERGNPYVITAFPTPTSVTGYQKTTPDPKRLIEEAVGDDYVVLTQRPGYAAEAAWKNQDERPRFIVLNALRFLRLYQMMAIYAIQQAIAANRELITRFEQKIQATLARIWGSGAEVQPV